MAMPGIPVSTLDSTGPKMPHKSQRASRTPNRIKVREGAWETAGCRRLESDAVLWGVQCRVQCTWR